MKRFHLLVVMLFMPVVSLPFLNYKGIPLDPTSPRAIAIKNHIMPQVMNKLPAIFAEYKTYKPLDPSQRMIELADAIVAIERSLQLLQTHTDWYWFIPHISRTYLQAQKFELLIDIILLYTELVQLRSLSAQELSVIGMYKSQVLHLAYDYEKDSIEEIAYIIELNKPDQQEWQQEQHVRILITSLVKEFDIASLVKKIAIMEFEKHGIPPMLHDLVFRTIVQAFARDYKDKTLLQKYVRESIQEKLRDNRWAEAVVSCLIPIVWILVFIKDMFFKIVPRMVLGVSDEFLSQECMKRIIQELKTAGVA